MDGSIASDAVAVAISTVKVSRLLWIVSAVQQSGRKVAATMVYHW